MGGNIINLLSGFFWEGKLGVRENKSLEWDLIFVLNSLVLFDFFFHPAQILSIKALKIKKENKEEREEKKEGTEY